MDTILSEEQGHATAHAAAANHGNLQPSAAFFFDMAV
jgi:hypothetical protein